MRKLFIIFFILIGSVLFYTKTDIKEGNKFMKIQEQFEELESRNELMKATFSGGCFWCMEGPFEAMEGVEEVISGYSGGDVENPKYEQVISGTTGHRESVRIYFNPNKIKFSELLKTYWYQIDPTDSGGQFADRGEQYTTAIYCHSEEQKKLAEEAIKTLNESGEYDSEIVTEVIPVENFYPAEDYHQDFYKHSQERYQNYAQGSGRKDYIKNVTNSLNKVFSK
ncbi:peptide-methionine (S)-S-oxide reductase MsrA [Patescibacteria group bacterium]